MQIITFKEAATVRRKELRSRLGGKLEKPGRLGTVIGGRLWPPPSLDYSKERAIPYSASCPLHSVTDGYSCSGPEWWNP